MSLFETPAPPPVPTAPHTRVQHILYTAPYIRYMLESFLEGNLESNLLETDAIAETLSRIYLIGLAFSTDFWKEDDREMLEVEKERLLAELALLRKAQVKIGGNRQWNHFRAFFRTLTGLRLPSRKSPEQLSLSDERAEMKLCTAFAIMAMNIREVEARPAPAPPVIEPLPKRIADRVTRHNKETVF